MDDECGWRKQLTSSFAEHAASAAQVSVRMVPPRNYFENLLCYRSPQCNSHRLYLYEITLSEDYLPVIHRPKGAVAESYSFDGFYQAEHCHNF